jgi:AcrR family transcriptional regulator
MTGIDSMSVSSRVASRRGRRRVSTLHRSRLLAGAVEAADELGYWRTTIAEITARSGVSRGTFYALFADRDECLAAVLEDFVELVERELARATAAGRLAWEERIAVGLATTLRLMDSERPLARVCVVEAARGGPRLLGLQEQAIARLSELIDEGRADAPGGGCATRLTAEILAGAIFRVVHSRLSRGEGSLIGLFGELMGVVVLPYRGEIVSARERKRPLPRATTPPRSRRAGLPAGSADPPRIRLTYRTTRVLEVIAQHPGATNSTVALHAGGVDKGQMSKLLRRLEDHGLISNNGEARHDWSTNTWSLTPLGETFMTGVGRAGPLSSLLSG